MDSDGDGNVSQAELTHALENNDRLNRVLAKAGLDTTWFVMEQLDNDGDGRITQHEFNSAIAAKTDIKPKLREAFKAVDTDGSGTISKAEFSAALEASDTFGHLLDDAGINTDWFVHDVNLDELDADGDGTITVGDFEVMLDARIAVRANPKYKELFHAIDVDGSGAVTQSELAQAMEKTPALLEMLVRAGVDTNMFVLEQLDVNQDELVTFEEFQLTLDGPFL